MPDEYTVTDSTFAIYGPFATLREARRCTQTLNSWVITETASGLVIDSDERTMISLRTPL